MKTFSGRFALVAVAAFAVLLLAETTAHAQVGRPGGPRPVVIPPLGVPQFYNPYTALPNGMTLGQYVATTSVLANTYSQIPPWLLGYNPYPTPIVNLGPTYAPQVYTPPAFSPVLSPYAVPNFYTNPYFSFFRTFP